MADQFEIQRVPAGLQNVLNLFGPGTPPRLAQELLGVVDLLQFYGLNQRQVLSNVGTPAIGGTVTLNLNPNNWALLYAARCETDRTATQTSLGNHLAIQRGTSGLYQVYAAVIDAAPGKVGELESILVPPYPLLLPPGSSVRCGVTALAGDATVNCTVTAEVGFFG